MQTETGSQAPACISLQAGDLVLMSRPCMSMSGVVGPSICAAAKLMSGSAYDHVGIVVEALDPDDQDDYDPFASININNSNNYNGSDVNEKTVKVSEDRDLPKKTSKSERMKSGRLYLLEANFGGVTCYPLKDRIGMTKSPLIAVRKLVMPESVNPDYKSDLWQFAKSIMKADYNYSFLQMTDAMLNNYKSLTEEPVASILPKITPKILIDNNIVKSPVANNNNAKYDTTGGDIDHMFAFLYNSTSIGIRPSNVAVVTPESISKTFTCSQLVISALASMGFVALPSTTAGGDSTKASHQYIPSNFASSICFDPIRYSNQNCILTPDIAIVNPRDSLQFLEDDGGSLRMVFKDSIGADKKSSESNQPSVRDSSSNSGSNSDSDSSSRSSSSSYSNNSGSSSIFGSKSKKSENLQGELELPFHSGDMISLSTLRQLIGLRTKLRERQTIDTSNSDSRVNDNGVQTLQKIVDMGPVATISDFDCPLSDMGGSAMRRLSVLISSAERLCTSAAISAKPISKLREGIDDKINELKQTECNQDEVFEILRYDRPINSNGQSSSDSKKGIYNRGYVIGVISRADVAIQDTLHELLTSKSKFPDSDDIYIRSLVHQKLKLDSNNYFNRASANRDNIHGSTGLDSDGSSDFDSKRRSNTNTTTTTPTNTTTTNNNISSNNSDYNNIATENSSRGSSGNNNSNNNSNSNSFRAEAFDGHRSISECGCEHAWIVDQDELSKRHSSLDLFLRAISEVGMREVQVSNKAEIDAINSIKSLIHIVGVEAINSNGLPRVYRMRLDEDAALNEALLKNNLVILDSGPLHKCSTSSKKSKKKYKDPDAQEEDGYASNLLSYRDLSTVLRSNQVVNPGILIGKAAAEYSPPIPNSSLYSASSSSSSSSIAHTFVAGKGGCHLLLVDRNDILRTSRSACATPSVYRSIERAFTIDPIGSANRYPDLNSGGSVEVDTTALKSLIARSAALEGIDRDVLSSLISRFDKSGKIDLDSFLITAKLIVSIKDWYGSNKVDSSLQWNILLQKMEVALNDMFLHPGVQASAKMNKSDVGSVVMETLASIRSNDSTTEKSENATRGGNDASTVKKRFSCCGLLLFVIPAGALNLNFNFDFNSNKKTTSRCRYGSNSRTSYDSKSNSSYGSGYTSDAYSACYKETRQASLIARNFSSKPTQKSSLPALVRYAINPALLFARKITR